MNRAAAIVVAAGSGKRFGRMKQFVFLRGKPVLEWTLEKFETQPEVDCVILVLPDEEDFKHYRSRYPKIAGIVRGGERRQDSVWQGFRLLPPDETGLVLVHDGARPLVDAALISRVISKAREAGAAVPVVPLDETIKEVRDGRIVRSLDRSVLGRTQTPQAFLYPMLKKALDAARRERFYGTDEAMLAERAGIPVAVVDGDPRNIKITTPLDLKIAEALLDA